MVWKPSVLKNPKSTEVSDKFLESPNSLSPAGSKGQTGPGKNLERPNPINGKALIFKIE